MRILASPTQAFTRHRHKLLAVVAVVMLYALLGFCLLPWVVKSNAIKSVKENLNAELGIADVAINPFVLSLSIDGLELDDPAGAASSCSSSNRKPEIPNWPWRN
ncbi:MAG: hypothetical protein ACREQ1_01375 [Woeseiaceae bacterium]